MTIDDYAHRIITLLQPTLTAESFEAARHEASLRLEEAQNIWFANEHRLDNFRGAIDAAILSFTVSWANLNMPPSQEKATAILTSAVATGEICSITMTPIVLSSDCAVTPCGHAFNSVALFAWLTDHYTCPLCRKFCNNESVAKGPVASSKPSRLAETIRMLAETKSSRRSGNILIKKVWNYAEKCGLKEKVKAYKDATGKYTGMELGGLLWKHLNREMREAWHDKSMSQEEQGPAFNEAVCKEMLEAALDFAEANGYAEQPK
jgi:hypothetical protein